MHCHQRGQLPPTHTKRLEISRKIWEARSGGSWEPEGQVSQVWKFLNFCPPRSSSHPGQPTWKKASSCMVAGPWRRRAKLGQESTRFSLALQMALWQLRLKSLLGASRLQLCIPPPLHGPDRNKRIHVNLRGVWRNRRQDSPICLVTATESAKLVSQEIFLEELFNRNAWRSTRIAITRSVLIF